MEREPVLERASRVAASGFLAGLPALSDRLPEVAIDSLIASPSEMEHWRF